MDVCILCKSSKKDDIQYGEFLKKKHFGVHTFCLYLSSNLSQKGEEDQGFLGFLDKDIRQEVTRVSRLKCIYCRKMYANIGCCETKCRNTFHMICGLENYAENQFCNEFRSYCHRHVRKTRQRPSSTETCLICYENIYTPEKKFKSVNMILTPCCRNGWFHKLCLLKFAKTAGYFFKCPLCNDSETFRQKLRAKGIFIPDQDASWELEPNAFAELLERPNTCSAKQCKNKKGRMSVNDQNPFVYCCTCGSIAMHKYCLLAGTKRFHCNDCAVVTDEGTNERKSIDSHYLVDHEEDDYIEVCYASDRDDINKLKLIADTTNKKEDHNLNDKSIKVSRTSRKMRILSDDEHQVNLKTTQFSKINKHRLCDTETSENSEDEVIKPSSSIHLRRQRIESESQASATSSSGIQNNLKATIDSDSSETFLSYCTKRRKKTRRLSSDREEDTKPTRSDCKNVNKEQILIEDSDDDPLENFEKYVPKQNISCVALRTRRKSQNLEQTCNMVATINYRGNKENQTQDIDNNNTSKSNNLDTSSEDKRIRRRKTIHTIIKEKPQLRTLDDNKQSPLNISCIAKRTRRKTICAQTQSEYFENNLQQSQIYEKLHESEYNCDKDTTEDESPSVTKTSFDCESYKENCSISDVSCIANRTRKRKSLKQFFQEQTANRSCSTSSSSSTSSKTYMPTNLDSFIIYRKRCMQRILSTSSEESNTSQPHTTFLAKISQTNIEHYQKPSYAPLQNYHPNSPQRKRL